MPAAQESPSGNEAGTASVGKTETVLSRGELDADMAAPVQSSLPGTPVMQADESLDPIDDAIEEQLKELSEELQAIENSMPDENEGIHSDRAQHIAPEQTAGDLGIALVNNSTIPSPRRSGEKRTNDPLTPQSDAEMEAILASIGDGEVQEPERAALGEGESGGSALASPKPVKPSTTDGIAADPSESLVPAESEAERTLISEARPQVDGVIEALGRLVREVETGRRANASVRDQILQFHAKLNSSWRAFAPAPAFRPQIDLAAFADDEDELSCCRFRGHRDRCFMEPEVGYGATAIYAGV